MIERLSWEFLLNEVVNDGVVGRPSWIDVECNLNKLSETDSGLVTLNSDDGSVLMVGGQSSIGFVVNLSDGDDHRCLTSDISVEGSVTIVIGLQPGEFSKRVVVKLSAALEACHHYFLSGKRNLSGEWTKDFNIR